MVEKNADYGHKVGTRPTGRLLIFSCLFCLLGGIAPDIDHLIWGGRSYFHGSQGLGLGLVMAGAGAALVLGGLAVALGGRYLQPGLLRRYPEYSDAE